MSAAKSSQEIINTMKIEITGYQFQLHKKDEQIKELTQQLNKINDLIKTLAQEDTSNKAIELFELKNAKMQEITDINDEKKTQSHEEYYDDNDEEFRELIDRAREMEDEHNDYVELKKQYEKLQQQYQKLKQKT
eukprot:108034_1